MAYSSTVAIYTCLPLPDPAGTLRDLMNYCRADRVDKVYVWNNHNWELLRGVFAGTYVGPPVSVYVEDDAQLLVREPSQDEIVRLLDPSVCVSVPQAGCWISSALYRESADLPVDIMMAHRFGVVSVDIGRFEHYEVLNPTKMPVTRERIRYYGMSTAAIRISGGGLVKDALVAGNHLVHLPTIRQLERDLTSILGKVDVCVYWDR